MDTTVSDGGRNQEATFLFNENVFKSWNLLQEVKVFFQLSIKGW